MNAPSQIPFSFMGSVPEAPACKMAPKASDRAASPRWSRVPGLSGLVRELHEDAQVEVYLADDELRDPPYRPELTAPYFALGSWRK